MGFEILEDVQRGDCFVVMLGDLGNVQYIVTKSNERIWFLWVMLFHYEVLFICSFSLIGWQNLLMPGSGCSNALQELQLFHWVVSLNKTWSSLRNSGVLLLMFVLCTKLCESVDHLQGRWGGTLNLIGIDWVFPPKSTNSCLCGPMTLDQRNVELFGPLCFLLPLRWCGEKETTWVFRILSAILFMLLSYLLGLPPRCLVKGFSIYVDWVSFVL